jgi:hypothetical protein
MSAKPHFRVVDGQPKRVIRTTTTPSPQVAAAGRKYGKPFGVMPWAVGEGPRYWTHDRVGRLAAQNEEDRMRRQRDAKNT